MKIFIINYNRLTYLKNTIEWALSNDLQPIVLDNASTYHPLLDYYRTNPCPIYRFKTNQGHKVLWNNPILFKILRIKGQYLVTDPDLDLTNVPKDFLKVMEAGLHRYTKYTKCGLSLEINDLPNTVLGNAVKEWESQFWTRPLDEMYYEAGVDTTFALYRNQNFSITPSLRLNRPYTAKHLPWYYADLSKLPKDEQHYIKTANSSFSWKDKIIGSSNFIIATYLTTAIDEQRNVQQVGDTFNYIQAWYNSVILSGSNGIILHDNLSDDFLKLFPKITFVKYPRIPKGMSLYEYRWHIAYEFLQTVESNNVFFTDVSDCTIINNPFEQRDYKTETLYCGDEPCFIRENDWLQRCLLNAHIKNLPNIQEIWQSNMQVLNPGILGGDTKTVLNFLKVFTEFLTKLKYRGKDETVDMGIFNYVMNTQFAPVHGYPVNSKFKAYENNNKVWFKHK